MVRVRRRLSLGVAVLACVGALQADAAAPAHRATVLHYGDSLTVGTGLFLPAFLPGWSITQSASVSRTR